jgi:HEAT repeat protein
VVITLATELASGHLDIVTQRMNDQRALVVRDAVAVAYRAFGAESLSILEMAARHPSPEVRQEAVRGLIVVGGASAIGGLQEFVHDTDDRVRKLAVGGLAGLTSAAAVDALVEVATTEADQQIRRDAMDYLARHPAPVARERLRSLASRRNKPRLPRPLRRYAKSLVNV